MLPAFLPSPPFSSFHVGPLTIHIYGVAYVVGLIVAVAITERRWAAVGGAPGLWQEVAPWIFGAGVIGGRLYYVATSPNNVFTHWWTPFAIWQGGMGIWGGIITATLAGVLLMWNRDVSVILALDIVAPALLVAQAIGRIGNYFNQELFGAPTALPWGLEISRAHRPIDYSRYITFHPTFLYELIWDLTLAALLVWLGRYRLIRTPGLFALYLAGYSLGRVGEEILRIDPSRHIFGLRLNLYVATASCLVGMGWFVHIQHWGSRTSLRSSN
jgi:prolipoprotein diacylglyceryl transferase